MKLLHTVVACVCALALGAQGRAQTGTEPFRLAVEYDRPGLAVPHWRISIPEHGLAEYTGKPEKGNDPGAVAFQVSEGGRAKLGGLLSRSKGLQPCETKSKGLANMGAKSVIYAPAGGPEAHCTFNYTDNKPLSEALEYVLAMANTLQAGLELDRLHRYDRLGLDPVIIHLSDDVKEGRATEIGAIRPTLESLLTDEALLERVRTRAQQLLALAKLQESNLASK